MRDEAVFLLKLIGSVVFCVTVLALGTYFAQMSDDHSFMLMEADKSEIARLQPAAMAEATYQINAELERRFKP